MSERQIIRLVSWPDPIRLERLEEMGFFHGKKSWSRYCSSDEIQGLVEWLKKHHLAYEILPALGAGDLQRLPTLSSLLLLPNGGSPTQCALCGAAGLWCRQWIEGDDTDSIDYPQPRRFYLCGSCVQERLAPHPRLYVPAEDQL